MGSIPTALTNKNNSLVPLQSSRVKARGTDLAPKLVVLSCGAMRRHGSNNAPARCRWDKTPESATARPPSAPLSFIGTVAGFGYGARKKGTDSGAQSVPMVGGCRGREKAICLPQWEAPAEQLRTDGVQQSARARLDAVAAPPRRSFTYKWYHQRNYLCWGEHVHRIRRDHNDPSTRQVGR